MKVYFWAVWRKMGELLFRAVFFRKCAVGKMMRSVWAVWLFAALLLGACVLHDAVNQRLYYGGFVVSTADGVRLQFLRQGDLSLEHCERKASQVVKVYQDLCPTCQVQKSSCTDSPSDFVLHALSESALNVPSARTSGGGALLYLSSDAKLALDSCVQSARLSGAMNCTPPGQVRPLLAQEFSAKNVAWRPDRVIGSILMALGAGLLLILALLVWKRKEAGQRFSSAFVLRKLFLVGVDVCTLMLAYFLVGLPDLANPVQLYQYDLRLMVLQFILITLTVGWLWINCQHYVRRHPLWDELQDLLKTVMAVTLMAGTALFYSEVEGARQLTLWAWGASVVLLPIGRIAGRQLLNVCGVWKRPVLILGTGQNAQDAFRAIRGEFSLGYQVVGFVDIEETVLSAEHTAYQVPSSSMDVLGQAYPRYVHDESFDELWVRLGKPQLVMALESLAQPESQRLLHQLCLVSDNVHVIPSLRGLPLFGAQVSHFFSHEVVFLTVRNNLARRSYQRMKRCFDVVVSAWMLLLLAPVMLVLAWLVRQDGGKAFYGHVRIGKEGKPFRCLKFRSMHADSANMLTHILETDPQARAEWERDFKLKNDPRVTPVGRFLRKTSLDELPQLVNVLRGEMSLVGPRPIVEAELERYADSKAYYLSVMPGITGLWQVSGRNDTTYQERVALDAWYAQNWSLWYDLAILFKTIGVVFRRDGAY